MSERAVEAICRECGRPVSSHDDRRAVRCAVCFDAFLSERDAEFLGSYSELGVASRRVVAETCFRALVMESPPHRKVLAMNIMEQYALAASDLVALYAALKQRGRAPVMRTMAQFKLDRASATGFFHEIINTPVPDLLEGLGLPMPDAIGQRCPSLPKKDVEDLRRVMEQMLYDLQFTGTMGETAALALAQMAGQNRDGSALLAQSAWLDNVGLRRDQVAAMSIDEARRTVNVNAISVDEKKLEHVVTSINAMTRAAQNMIYAVLTMYQEDERAGRRTPRTGKPAPDRR